MRRMERVREVLNEDEPLPNLGDPAQEDDDKTVFSEEHGGGKDVEMEDQTGKTLAADAGKTLEASGKTLGGKEDSWTF